MRYGVPYKGSKNQIAEWVCSHFPKASNFYDLFAGGCAITHCAMEKSVLLNSGASKKAIEKLFIPKHQRELYKKLLNKKR